MRSLVKFLLFLNLIAIQLLQLLKFAIILGLVTFFLVIKFVTQMLDLIFEATILTH
jgi:hypothetical protein